MLYRDMEISLSDLDCLGPRLVLACQVLFDNVDYVFN